MINLPFFIKKHLKNLEITKKLLTFALANRNTPLCALSLGYGVMVTLQILVLSFLVRVRVSQQIPLNFSGIFVFCASFCWYMQKM